MRTLRKNHPEHEVALVGLQLAAEALGTLFRDHGDHSRYDCGLCTDADGIRYTLETYLSLLDCQAFPWTHQRRQLVEELRARAGDAVAGWSAAVEWEALQAELQAEAAGRAVEGPADGPAGGPAVAPVLVEAGGGAA